MALFLPHFFHMINGHFRTIRISWPEIYGLKYGTVRLRSSISIGSWRSPIDIMTHYTGWWFQTWRYDFPFHIWDVVLPIDELIFFKMVKTTNQL